MSGATKSIPTGKVLILGGYGAAGKAIATHLSKRMTGAITVAGRSMAKAQACADQLNRELSSGVDFFAASVDVADHEQITQSCKGQNVVLLACDASPESIESLVRGCVANGADYIDITPHARKRAVFESLTKLIDSGKSRFVLDAGADPGLPGWLTRWLCKNSPEDLGQIEIYGRYRSTDIGWGGVADILKESDSQGWIYDGRWRRSPFWDCKLKSFEGGLGRSLCVPIRLDELESLPEELGLQVLKCYHAGLNPVADTLITLERSPLIHWMSFETRQRLFYQALKRFTKKPFGLSIEAEGTSAHRQFRAAIGHSDLYVATAIPAVLMCEFLLDKNDGPAGYGYLGYWADAHPGFVDELKKEGFWFKSWPEELAKNIGNVL